MLESVSCCVESESTSTEELTKDVLNVDAIKNGWNRTLLMVESVSSCVESDAVITEPLTKVVLNVDAI